MPDRLQQGEIMGARTGEAYIEGLRDDRRIYVNGELVRDVTQYPPCLLYTSPSPRDRQKSRMPSSA